MSRLLFLVRVDVGAQLYKMPLPRLSATATAAVSLGASSTAPRLTGLNSSRSDSSQGVPSQPATHRSSGQQDASTVPLGTQDGSTAIEGGCAGPL